jgi:hypothetical protein
MIPRWLLPLRRACAGHHAEIAWIAGDGEEAVRMAATQTPT